MVLTICSYVVYVVWRYQPFKNQKKPNRAVGPWKCYSTRPKWFIIRKSIDQLIQRIDFRLWRVAFYRIVKELSQVWALLLHVERIHPVFSLLVLIIWAKIPDIHVFLRIQQEFPFLSRRIQFLRLNWSWHPILHLDISCGDSLALLSIGVILVPCIIQHSIKPIRCFWQREWRLQSELSGKWCLVAFQTPHWIILKPNDSFFSIKSLDHRGSNFLCCYHGKPIAIDKTFSFCLHCGSSADGVIIQLCFLGSASYSLARTFVLKGLRQIIQAKGSAV